MDNLNPKNTKNEKNNPNDEFNSEIIEKSNIDNESNQPK